jgi:hypothetical protein
MDSKTEEQSVDTNLLDKKQYDPNAPVRIGGKFLLIPCDTPLGRNRTPVIEEGPTGSLLEHTRCTLVLLRTVTAQGVCAFECQLVQISSPIPELPSDLWRVIFRMTGLSDQHLLRSYGTVSAYWRSVIGSLFESLRCTPNWMDKHEQHPRFANLSLSHFSNLTSLDVKFWKVIESVRSLTRLTHLRARGNVVSNSTLKELTRLHSLTLDENEMVSDGGIVKLTNITALDLNLRTNVTVRGLLSLPNLTTLRLSRLNFSSCRISDEVSVLTNLRQLELPFNMCITHGGLRTLTNLTSLYLDGNCSVANYGLACLTNLTDLNLAGNTRITTAGLKPLTKLVRLNLSRTVYVSSVDTLVRLEELNLEENGKIATDSGLLNLPRLSRLLGLSEPRRTTFLIARMRHSQLRGLPCNLRFEYW